MLKNFPVENKGLRTGRGGLVVLGAISNSSRENTSGPRFESPLGNDSQLSERHQHNNFNIAMA